MCLAPFSQSGTSARPSSFIMCGQKRCRDSHSQNDDDNRERKPIGYGKTVANDHFHSDKGEDERQTCAQIDKPVDQFREKKVEGP